jgi:hypothetical protein
MSLSNIDLCTAAGGRTPRHSQSVTPASAGSPPCVKAPLVAQIPDLGCIPITPGNGDAGQRMRSQGFWRKVVLGSGVLFVIAAILPFTLKQKDSTRPVADELPAWQDNAASSGASAMAWSDSAQNAASAGPAGTNCSISRPSPASTPACLSPEPPFGASRPTAPGELGWPPAGPSGATVVQANDHPGQPVDYRVSDPAGQRPGELAGPRKDYQADLRSDPAAAFRGDPPSNPRGDWRNDPAPGNGHPDASAPQGNPLMPAVPAPPVEAPAASDQAPPAAEPGVARLDGTIASPPSEGRR